MAGSYDHATEDDGALRRPGSFMQMVENMGDAYETVEEMYGMIWFMATALERLDEKDSALFHTAQEWIKEAQEEYKVGILESPTQ